MSARLLNTSGIRLEVMKMALSCKEGRVLTFSFGYNGWAKNLLDVSCPLSVYVSNRANLDAVPESAYPQHRFRFARDSHAKAFCFRRRGADYEAVVGSMNLNETGWREYGCLLKGDEALELWRSFDSLEHSELPGREASPANPLNGAGEVDMSLSLDKRNLAVLKALVKALEGRTRFHADDLKFLLSVRDNFLLRGRNLSYKQEQKTVALLAGPGCGKAGVVSLLSKIRGTI